MNEAPTSRRRAWKLGLATAAAVAGLVGAAVWSAAPDGLLRYLTFTPSLLRCLAWLLGGLVALGGVVLVMIRLRPAGRGVRPWQLHAARDGTAAFEFVLVLPVALMILLVVAQSALLFNANMVVQYTAYATVRVASTLIPQEIGSELRNLVNNPDSASVPASTKLARLRRAAAMTLIPVSATLDTSVASIDDATGSVIQQEVADAFSSLGASQCYWFRRVESQYAYAWKYVEVDLAKPEHWRDGDPDADCPYYQQQQDEWNPQGGWTYTPYCPFYPDRMDYARTENEKGGGGLHVRVIYQFMLGMPYAGRFLGAATTVPGYSGTVYQAEIRATASLSNEGGLDPLSTE